MPQPMQQIRSMMPDNTGRFIQWHSCASAKVEMYFIGGKQEVCISNDQVVFKRVL